MPDHKVLSYSNYTLPRQWSLTTLASTKRTTHFILCPRLTTAASSLYSIGTWDGAPSTYDGHLSFDVWFICSTLTRLGVFWLERMTFKCFSSNLVHLYKRYCGKCVTCIRNVWRWKWFSCQSSYVLQRLRLAVTSNTVFRREIDSRRQWGYRTLHGVSFPPLRRSVQ